MTSINPIPPKIVLITIDGVRWEEIFNAHTAIGTYLPTSQELVPNLYQHFVREGMAIGKASLAQTANYAHVSLPGYTEIMTGEASRTCFDNSCGPNLKHTLVNEFAMNSAVFSSWEKIGLVFDNNLAITNVGRSDRNLMWRSMHLPDKQDFPDTFGNPNYRLDEYTMQATLDYVKLVQPQFLYVSLGDTDEFGHWNDQLRYWSALNAADHFISELMAVTSPNTIFVVCPDHGRSNNFRDHGSDVESARVWIMITGPKIPALGFVRYDRVVHLADIYPTIVELTKGISSNRSLLNGAH